VVGSRYIYWANDYTIGRARLNGAGVNQRFISVPYGPNGVAGLDVNSRYIYWTNENEQGDAVGRANLDGTDVNQRFITGASNPDALTVDSQYICWANWGTGSLGRARLNGTRVSQRIVTMHGRPRGVAVEPPP
jgi:virginiamycin B lyase